MGKGEKGSSEVLTLGKGKMICDQERGSFSILKEKGEEDDMEILGGQGGGKEAVA